ncbi:hypothetical protein F5Y17DRAFT_463711, partial [Xylariaceae sp. FL0594]
MATQFAFVSVEGAKGKEDSRRSLREARAKQAMVLAQRPKNEGKQQGRQQQEQQQPIEEVARAFSPSGSSSSASMPTDTSSEDDDSLDLPSMTMIRRHGGKNMGGASLQREMVRFMYEDTAVYPREMIFTSQTFATMKAIIYPMYENLQFWDKMTAPPFQWLVTDTLFRNAVLYHNAVAKSCVQGQPLNETAAKHRQATLNLLGRKLSDPTQSPLTQPVLWSMTILANASYGMARHDEVVVHTRAIRRLCQVYGGSDYIATRPTLRYYLYA